MKITLIESFYDTDEIGIDLGIWGWSCGIIPGMLREYSIFRIRKQRESDLMEQRHRYFRSPVFPYADFCMGEFRIAAIHGLGRYWSMMIANGIHRIWIRHGHSHGNHCGRVIHFHRWKGKNASGRWGEEGNGKQSDEKSFHKCLIPLGNVPNTQDFVGEIRDFLSVSGTEFADSAGLEMTFQ